MKYYSVKPEYNGKQLYKSEHKSGAKIPNGYSLIAHELLTEKEAEKLNVPQTCVDPVNVKKSQVYICFGARFEMETKGGFYS